MNLSAVATMDNLLGLADTTALLTKPMCHTCGADYRRNDGAYCATCTALRPTRSRLVAPCDDCGVLILRHRLNTLYCKKCKIAAHERALQRQAHTVRSRKYGLTREEIEAMEREQDHRCAICKERAKLVVDHCHDTLAVRGLLCSKCNAGIGLLRDDPQLLLAALAYLAAA